jgi:hypothetical protein
VVLSDAQTTEVWYQIADANGTSAWAKATPVIFPTNATALLSKEWRFDYKNIPNSGVGTIRVRFKERSSSNDNTLTDAQGWFTTLTRTVNTGTPTNFRIQFPGVDGTVVDTSYQAKLYFDKSLSYTAGGAEIPAAQLLNEFSVYFASEVSGETTGENFYPRSHYTFIRHETTTESALAFNFPNLYNGDAEFLHSLRVVHVRGGSTLSADRLVKAAVGPLADYDQDLLPDVWENQKNLDMNNPDGDFGKDGDRDQDGLTNLDEYLFNLSPNVPEAAPAPKIALRGALADITFPVLPGRKYRILTSTGLGSWAVLNAYFTPTMSSNRLWTVSASGPRRFYRVEVALP